ncbi:F-box protein FBW2 [Zea mays]|uniref:F-box protein FBW2 n=1 Tax=Zea mays TaxID=4577 RepID=A0A1D6HKT4_MAIZE|nr:F-box protein FBW2 [Zea mays]
MGECEDGKEYRCWEELLPDALGLIFRNLPLQEVLTVLPRVCKSWGRVVAGPYCWQEIDIEEWSQQQGKPERDQRLHGGIRGAAAAERHFPRHQQLHEDGGPRPGGVRQALQVPGGAAAGDAPDRPGGQGVPARRGARHRVQHAQAAAPGDGVHAGGDGGGGGDPGAVPRAQVPGPARLLGGGRQAPAARPPPGAARPGTPRRRLLREQLLGGVLRRLLGRLLHLLVGAHGRRRRRLRLRRRQRRRRRRGRLGRRRPGPGEPGGQVLRRWLRRDLRRLRLAAVAVT